MLAPFAILFLAAVASPPRVVFDGDLVVQRSRARGIPLHVEHPTHVHCRYEARSAGAQIRVALMTAADVKAYQDGLPHDLLAATGYASSGEFRALLMRAGDYFVLVDNRVDIQESQTVHAVVTGVEDRTLPHTLPPSRRRAIVAISLTLFAIVAGWSGWRLRGARLFE